MAARKKKCKKKTVSKNAGHEKVEYFLSFLFFSILMVSHIFKQYFTQPWMIFSTKNALVKNGHQNAGFRYPKMQVSFTWYTSLTLNLVLQFNLQT